MKALVESFNKGKVLVWADSGLCETSQKFVDSSRAHLQLLALGDGVEERRLGGDLAAVAGGGGEVDAAQGDDK